MTRYRAALAMPGATYRSVAAKLDVPRSTLHRLVPKNARGTEPPHDPDTGEVIETGSATVVATGTTEAALQKLVDIGQRHGLYTTDAATTQDAAGHFDPDRDMPAHLRRRGEGNGVPSAARPDLDERVERVAQ